MPPPQGRLASHAAIATYSTGLRHCHKWFPVDVKRNLELDDGSFVTTISLEGMVISLIGYRHLLNFLKFVGSLHLFFIFLQIWFCASCAA
jgi:hypothetical protein